MATGGDVPGRKERLEASSFDPALGLCCVCQWKNKRTVAVKYCVTCKGCYCTDCVNLPQLVPTLTEHVVVGKSDFRDKDTRDEFPSIPPVHCGMHPDNVIDMICIADDEIGCRTCIENFHPVERDCIRLNIPENVDILFDKEKIKRSEEKLRNVIQTAEAALRLRERCLADVLNAVIDAEKQLENYTDQLLKTVAELKQKTRDKLYSLQNEIKSVLSKQSFDLNGELAYAKHILKKATRAYSDSNNKSQQIIWSNLAANIATFNIKNPVCPDISGLLFQPYVTCEEMFDMLFEHSSLGDFSPSPSRKQGLPYKIVKKVNTSVYLKSDKRQFSIPGSCTLQDGTILLADYDNSSLKRLSLHDTSVTDCLQLPDRPWSVALISQKEAAVTVEKGEVRFIAIDTKLKITRTLKFDYFCRIIKHYNNEFYVSDFNGVNVYTEEAKYQNCYVRENMAVFEDICSFALSESGRVLFVADTYLGLIALEMESRRQVWCYKGGDLVEASSVCVDGRGGVFVCGKYSHNVLQFSESGEKIGEIVTETDGIVQPISICFDTKTSTLVVTQQRDDVVMQYQLTT